MKPCSAAMASRFKLTMVTIGVWQLVCLAMAQVYRYLIGPQVVATYSWVFGEPQADYESFARLTTYVGLLVITLPACVVSIAVFDRLAVCNPALARKLLILGLWEAATILMLALSHEYSFPYAISQLGWRLFGPPASVYSFRNLVLPRIIAWSECTIPIAWLAIWSYSHLCTFNTQGDGRVDGTGPTGVLD